MKTLFVALLLQSLPLLPRAALENPAEVSPVPQKLKKDYDKLWMRFIEGKDDAKLIRDLDKFLKKQTKDADAALAIKAYLDLLRNDETAAAQKFEQLLARNAGNRIARFYLAEIMFARGAYSRAASLYAEIVRIRPDLETKRQKALLLATENLLRTALEAERENRLTDAEALYRQALRIAPDEPAFHERLADLLTRMTKTDEAAAERQIAERLRPQRRRSGAADDAAVNELEDLGRWGSDIESFRQMRNAASITREQLASLIVRYFPQLTELRQHSPILTDIRDSRGVSEIQTVVALGLMSPLPNRTFEPASQVTRGDFALAMAGLIRILGLPAADAPPVSAPDLSSSNARYREVQSVLGYRLLELQDSVGFNAGGLVSGREAVAAAEKLVRSFQQVRH